MCVCAGGGLLGKDGSASLLSLPGSTVLPARQGSPGRGCRAGLYLPRAVVQVHQDIQGLQHGAHGVDHDQGAVSLQGPVAQPAQVAAGWREGHSPRGCLGGAGEGGASPPRQSFPPPPSPLSLDIRGEKGQELDTVHSPGHPHVPEVRAVTVPGGRGERGRQSPRACILPRPRRTPLPPSAPWPWSQ